MDILGSRPMTADEEREDAERAAAEKERHAGVLATYASYISVVESGADFETRREALRLVVPFNDADRHASTLKGLLPKAVDEIKQARAAEEWTYMSHLLDLLANLARGATVRDPLQQVGALDLALDLVSSSSDSLVRTNSFRTLANSIYEHIDNRRFLHELGILNVALSAAESGDSTVVIAALGTLANLFHDEEALQKEALAAGIMRVLLSKLHDPNREVVKAAGITLLAVLDTDESVSEFLKLDGINEILRLSRAADVEVAEMAISSLAILCEDERFRRPMYDVKAVDYLIDLAGEPETPPQIQRAVTKVIALALTDDENMRDLFDQGRLALFAKWISGANDPEVRAYVALCISNMARKDEYCIAIANSAVVAPLLDMLQSANVKEVNGAVGVFRNLVLPAANKTPLGERGLIARLTPLLSHESAPLRFPVVIILKNLVIDNARNATEFVELDGPALLARLFEESYHDGSKFESARALVSLLRLRNADVTRAVLAVGGAYAMLAELLASKHAVLRNEVVAAASLFLDKEAVSDDARGRLLEAFAPHMANVLDQDEDAGKIGLLGFVLAASQGSGESIERAKKAMRETGAVEVVERAAKSGNAAVAQRAQAVLKEYA